MGSFLISARIIFVGRSVPDRRIRVRCNRVNCIIAVGVRVDLILIFVSEKNVENEALR